MAWIRPTWVAGLVWSVVAALGVGAGLRPAWAYRPDSPKVQQMLEKGASYLRTAPRDVLAQKIGGEALVSLAIHKYEKRFGSGGKDLDPIVAATVARAKGLANNAAELRETDNYSLGITLIFLTEVKPDLPELEIYVRELLSRQQPGGGWGYPTLSAARITGDTSQTQYAVLGMWAAYNVGFQIPPAAMEKVTYWLIRTQDPSGAFGYQGNDPGDFTRVPQQEVRISLCAAGLGSLYVAADFLGFSKKPDDEKGGKKAAQLVSLPPALIPVLDENAKIKGGKKQIVHSALDQTKLRAALDDGNAWFEQHMTYVSKDWQYYYIYGLERYLSFKELVENKFEAEPDWYNKGVDYLAERQGGSGAFGSPSESHNAGLQVDTAFAMLFLLRSTRETIDRVAQGEGLLVGGYGLPKDTSNIRLSRENKVVTPQITGTVDQLVLLLEDEQADQIEQMLDHPDAMSISGMQGAGSEFTARLQRIVRGGSYKARMVAVRALGRQGSLDNVPILLYALTDPDPRVVATARDALRLTSRKFDGLGMPESPTKADVDAGLVKWKAWYRSIRPDAVFYDE